MIFVSRGQGEIAAAFGEKRPVFLKVVFVRGELVDEGVGLDLAEVGAGRDVQVKVGLDAPLDVHAARGLRVGLVLPRGRPDPRVWEELEVIAGPDTGKTAELSGLLELRQVAVDVGPVVGFVQPVDIPFEVDAPNLVLLGGKAQGLEGDGHLGAPTVRAHRCLRFPDRFHGILLDALGVQGEGDARPLVVVGVQDEGDRIVVVELVAGRELGPDLARQGVLHQEGEIDVILVVCGPNVGFFGSL